jgi:hypothetical protein
MQKRVCVVAALLSVHLVGCTGRRRYLAADHKFYQAKDYKRPVIASRNAAQSVHKYYFTRENRGSRAWSGDSGGGIGGRRNAPGGRHRSRQMIADTVRTWKH